MSTPYFDLDYDSEEDFEESQLNEIIEIIDVIVFEKGITDIIIDYKIEVEEAYIIEKNNNDWYKISKNEKLNEDFMNKYSDKLFWHEISKSQKLSENFITKYYNKIFIIPLMESGKIEHFTDNFYKMLDERYEMEKQELIEAQEAAMNMDDYFTEEDMDEWRYYNNYEEDNYDYYGDFNTF